MLEIGSNQTNVKAIISLTLGVLSVVFIWASLLGIVLAIAGIIFGVIGLRETKHSGQSGRGKAVAGLICSAVGILIPLVLIVLYYGLTTVGG